VLVEERGVEGEVSGGLEDDDAPHEGHDQFGLPVHLII
jgi:hypothetical protein